MLTPPASFRSSRPCCQCDMATKQLTHQLKPPNHFPSAIFPWGPHLFVEVAVGVVALDCQAFNIKCSSNFVQRNISKSQNLRNKECKSSVLQNESHEVDSCWFHVSSAAGPGYGPRHVSGGGLERLLDWQNSQLLFWTRGPNWNELRNEPFALFNSRRCTIYHIYHVWSEW